MKQKYFLTLVVTLLCHITISYGEFRFEAHNRSSFLVVLHTSAHRHLTLLPGDNLIYISDQGFTNFNIGYIDPEIQAIRTLNCGAKFSYNEYLFINFYDPNDQQTISSNNQSTDPESTPTISSAPICIFEGV